MRAKWYGTAMGKTVQDRYGQNGTGPVRAKQYRAVRAKRYKTGTSKTVRGPYEQNGTGPVGAKKYGTGRGKTVRGPYGQDGTGPVGQNGTGPIRATVWARYVARTFHRVQPVLATYRGPLGARTAFCCHCPYHARTGMFTGTLPINCFFRCSVHQMNGQPDN